MPALVDIGLWISKFTSNISKFLQGFSFGYRSATNTFPSGRLDAMACVSQVPLVEPVIAADRHTYERCPWRLG